MKTYAHQPSGTVTRARQLRRDSTEAERILWRALRDAFPDRKWRRQMPIGPYFADFACFAERLIIEVDGGQHAVSPSTDLIRTRFLEREGYCVIRLWNNDVTGNLDGVIGRIAMNLMEKAQ